MTLEALAKLDDRLSHRIRLTSEQRGWWQLVTFLAHSGDSWFWLAGLGIIWLLAIPEWHGKAVVLSAGIVMLAALVLAIKFTVRRRRPTGEWGAIYRNTDPHSFPSGHAARVFMLALMAVSLGPGWFGWLLVVWAPLVSLARVMTGLHYLTDVLAGMVLGLLAGMVMLQLQPLLMAFFPFMF